MKNSRKSVNLSNIPSDILEKIKNDHLATSDGITFYNEIINLPCPSYPIHERFEFIRKFMREQPSKSMGQIYYEFKMFIKDNVKFNRITNKRDVLIELEKIIGYSFYNDNIQNYSSWGVWESQGRAFRYPVTFYDGHQMQKSSTIPKNIDMRSLKSGYYALGANQLYVFEALLAIIEYLEMNYGLDLSKKIKKT